MALRSTAGHGLLILEVPRSHTNEPDSVGLLWTSDQLVAEISTITHNTHKREISMPPAGFEPTISESERPHTYALDSAATDLGMNKFMYIFICIHVHIPTGS